MIFNSSKNVGNSITLEIISLTISHVRNINIERHLEYRKKNKTHSFRRELLLKTGWELFLGNSAESHISHSESNNVSLVSSIPVLHPTGILFITLSMCS